MEDTVFVTTLGDCRDISRPHQISTIPVLSERDPVLDPALSSQSHNSIQVAVMNQRKSQTNTMPSSARQFSVSGRFYGEMPHGQKAHLVHGNSLTFRP